MDYGHSAFDIVAVNSCVRIGTEQSLVSVKIEPEKSYAVIVENATAAVVGDFQPTTPPRFLHLQHRSLSARARGALL